MRNTNKIFFLFLAFICYQPLLGQNLNFRPENFEFIQKVSIPEKTGAVYGIIPVTRDLQQKSKLRDIRIESNGTEVPYILRSVESTAKSYQTGVLIELNQVDRDGRTVVVKVPEPGEGYELTEIVLGNTGLYESSVSVSVGLPDRFRSAGNQPIFSFQSTKELSIRIDPPTQQQYIRLRFPETRKVSVSHAVFKRGASKSGIYEKIDMEDLAVHYDPDIQATIIEYANDQKNHISRLKLGFTDESYSRTVVVEAFDFNEKRYYEIGSGTIQKQHKEQPEQLIVFDRSVTDKFKIKIYNQDNPELNLASAEVFIPEQELLVQLPQESDLTIYSGYDYAFSPEYDLTDSYDDKLQHIRLNPEALMENPDFAYSAVEPPVSIWIMRILFVIGLLLFALPAIRIFKKYSEVMEKEKSTESAETESNQN